MLRYAMNTGTFLRKHFYIPMNNIMLCYEQEGGKTNNAMVHYVQFNVMSKQCYGKCLKGRSEYTSMVLIEILGLGERLATHRRQYVKDIFNASR